MTSLPDPRDVIRVVMVDAPQTREPGEGVFEWRHMTTQFWVDLLGLEKELKKILPDKADVVIDRLYNFKKIFINTRTGEVLT